MPALNIEEALVKAPRGVGGRVSYNSQPPGTSCYETSSGEGGGRNLDKNADSGLLNPRSKMIEPWDKLHKM